MALWDILYIIEVYKRGQHFMKVLYFTSTGNCLYIAKRIGGELLSIPQIQKNKIYEIIDDVVGIVVPIYGFDVPRPVRFYLNNIEIKADYIFTIMSYGNLSMGALTQMKKLLKSRNIILNYANEIKMVDNYLPYFEIEKQLKMGKNKDSEIKINEIINDIQERKHTPLKQGIFKNFISEIFSAMYLSKKVGQLMNNSAKNFIVNDSCTSCGICREVCPMANISGTNKPEYLNKCEFCLSCVHLCPQNAIHLKNEKSNKRFINPHIKLSEIINSNKQT
jgi:ferredoxin